MSLSFASVVACNNLVALKGFSVFLTNYGIHQKPGFLMRLLIPRAKTWIQIEALRQFEDIKTEVQKYSVNVALNDCPTPLFTCLYLAQQQLTIGPDKLKIKSGEVLFSLMASTELALEKLKKPRAEAVHG